MLVVVWESIDICSVSLQCLSLVLLDISISKLILSTLLGLRKLVQEGENAELLSDPLVKRSSTWNMSTSQIYIRHAPSYG